MRLLEKWWWELTRKSGRRIIEVELLEVLTYPRVYNRFLLEDLKIWNF